ncbi:apolipoprotein L3-like [Sardina pilchardus]|uniref:apolipoprotein L3-like n=1 Tax=Sardina pilchardus TaxID=27697 RepID=UPI002E14C1BC
MLISTSRRPWSLKMKWRHGRTALPAEMEVGGITVSVKKHIRSLRKTIGQLESVHRRSTACSLSGGVISAVGGVTSIVGLIMAPFTFGASLAVTGVGMVVTAAGGITGVASNITKMTREKTCQEKIKEILDDCNSRLTPVLSNLQNFTGSVQDCQASISAGKPLSGLIQRLKLTPMGKEAPEATRPVGVSSKMTPKVNGLSLILDMVSIASDVREMQEIRKRAKGRRRSESEMLMFITQVEEAARELEMTVFELDRLEGINLS